MTKKRVLSGVQPTGNLHIGNYLGAIRNWVELQPNYDNFFCVVDLHAITVPHNPATLAQDTYTIAALYLACGIDLNYSTIFVQSHVSAHSELAWLLNCVTPLNWLERMIQFKEKAIKQGENVSVGLLDYPILMAADILLYDADQVPVGEDQKQHLELTRDIAMRFNDKFGGEKNPIFKIPEPLIRQEGARIMSLADGTKKMSKSDPSPLSRISLLDSSDDIQKKIKKCKTDTIMGLNFANDRPECNNLLGLYGILTEKTKEEVILECSDMGWGKFKPLLTDAIINALTPIQTKYNEIMTDKNYLDSVLKEGKEKAESVANITLKRVKDALGYLIITS
ncbi:MAG: tryptophan--tRNA ligase [Cyanobacteria bacterium]|nr:tryptophan--tRNA ligase [Cyanobacteria bacterium CG_2015-16_32_12]NCO76745.1 tryptophan--tRNA ligase [Cyanobacteria bacterium CG_2015-22_32_23]NCQ04391.1 tryptophan--tRNA ligase [Cyanobacteria bacterium CG_2015-09_32_10]NCQ43003.1 tryptophan--tRNA ligase [Cyanobacteria bacterium CG_2015-04_32_10]NCS84936.1 tryptophan--tRNA ligase [Cyanobacteria bacterium CG_2015-02_32_10]